MKIRHMKNLLLKVLFLLIMIDLLANASCSLSGPTIQEENIILPYCYDLVFHGNYMYLLSTADIYVYLLSNEKGPEKLNHYPIEGQKMTINNNALYISNCGGTVYMYSIEYPESIYGRGRLLCSRRDIQDISANGHTLYCTTDDMGRMIAYDISDPFLPVYLSESGVSTYGDIIHADDSFIVTASDVTYLSEYPDLNMDSNKIFLCGHDDSCISKLSDISFDELINDADVLDDRLFVLEGNYTVKTFNMSNRTFPLLTDAYLSKNALNCIYAYNDYLYAGGDGFIAKFEVNDDGSLHRIYEATVDLSIERISAHNDYLIVHDELGHGLIFKEI